MIPWILGTILLDTLVRNVLLCDL